MSWNWRKMFPLLLTMLPLAGSLEVAEAAGATGGAAKGGRVHAARLDPQLQHLLMFRDGRMPIDAPFAPGSVLDATVRVYLTFAASPDRAVLRDLEARGVAFTKLPGLSEPAHVGRIYGVRIPWALLPVLAKDPRIEAIEAIERRGRTPAMDRSMPEIQVDALRLIPQANTDGLTGRGQIIAAFDTSVDLYHPALFKPDGGLYEWVDVNSDGGFDPGIDAVDLNEDGSIQSGEILRLQESPLFDSNFGPLVDGIFDADQDWLYADTNGNGKRDFGIDAGFGEKEPGYGEPLFIVDDEDGDGDLTPGEWLVRLGTSKVVAGMDGQSSATTHTRGSSLLTLTPDVYPHGTSAAGIMLGDVPGRRFVGVAPDAEMLAIDVEAPGVDEVSAMNWAKAQGADVMIYNFGEWTGTFLDGSSALEQAVTSMGASGIPQVCPAGNIGQNNKHGRLQVAAGGTATAIFFVDTSFFKPTATYLTALWRQTLPKLSFEVAFISADGVNPNPAVVAAAGSTVKNTQGDTISAVSSTSSKGTSMMDMTLFHKEGDTVSVLNAGLYTVTIKNTGTSTAILHMFLADDKTSWSGGVTWISGGSGGAPGAIADPAYSVSSPATADGCITVASYATRQSEILGNLSTFSSRGPRIDEASLLDVAAPGNYDIYAPTSVESAYYDASIPDFVNYPAGTLWLFSGTSASAPHVAGAAALLKQLDSSLTHTQIESAIKSGAVADSFTGTVPNERWGMGKLRVANTVTKADKGVPTFTVLADRHPVFANYLVLSIIPSERLQAPPQVSSSAVTVGPVVQVERDVYTSTFLAPKSGSSISVTVTGKDVAGNTGSANLSASF